MIFFVAQLCIAALLAGLTVLAVMLIFLALAVVMYAIANLGFLLEDIVRKLTR
ncbi:MAG TPA: hypothetical protein VKW08_00255 [Xanthobacteraceae bacterium]|nr:hypothetical protein [Xanthobacteraceae bacterium]